MNKYFVAYNWYTASEYGVGDTIIYYNKHIENYNDIIKIRKCIQSDVVNQKNYNVNISIINIIKLPI